MKLSIITINYNDAKGLRATIESVLAQSYRNFEYIVIDGGSNDGSRDIIELYKSKIDFSVSEKDKGIYNAMNKGANVAKGEYLLFLNSGDTLYSADTLSNLMLDTFHDDIVCGRVLNYSDTDSYLKIPPENVSLFTFVGGSLPHPSSFIKRDVFEKIGGYHENYKIISDWCFFVEALIRDRCSYSTIPNIITRFNRFGISSTAGQLEEPLKKDFLDHLFGPIMRDYIPVKDEALSNCVFWISSRHGTWGNIQRLPFKIFNRLLRLRNRLSRRMGVVKV